MMANETVPITAASHTPAGVQAQRSFVVFRLETQGYAIPVEAILQIIEMVAITPLPQVNPVVKGIINLRGEAVPVLSLRRYLGMAEIPLQLHTPIILVRNVETDATSTSWHKVGLIVDEVTDVISIRTGAITSLPGILPEGLRQTPIVEGLIHTAYETVILLDVAQLFTQAQAPLLPAKVVARQALSLEAQQTPESTPEEAAA